MSGLLVLEVLGRWKWGAFGREVDDGIDGRLSVFRHADLDVDGAAIRSAA
jgi:hypothetical protein